MLVESGDDQRGLHIRRNTAETHEQYSRVQQVLPENKVPEIFVGCEKDGVFLQTSVQHSLVVDSGIVFGDIKNGVSLGAKAFYDFTVDILVRNNLHP